MPKSQFLQIRVSPEDKKRVRRAAEADHLDQSTWARQAVLKAVDAWEKSSKRRGQD
jgi:predicted transcriptional regulator